MATPRDLLRSIVRSFPGGMAAGRWLNRRIDPALREIAALEARYGERLLQPYGDTAEERYPQLFDALAERLAPFPAPRVLSFGCSSGAELRALRRRLPGARLTGVDLNTRLIAAARSADRDSRYLVADAPPPDERFDAVLAMAVLRHGQLEGTRPDNCSAILPFVRVAETLQRLDAALEPGGYLAIWHAHFRFADSSLAPRYTADPLRIADAGAQDLLYGPDNRRLDCAPYREILFRKS